MIKYIIVLDLVRFVFEYVGFFFLNLFFELVSNIDRLEEIDVSKVIVIYSDYEGLFFLGYEKNSGYFDIYFIDEIFDYYSDNDDFIWILNYFLVN